MNRTVAAFIALLVPRSAFGEIEVSDQFDHPNGRDRLVLYRAIGPLYWRLMSDANTGGKVGEPHALVWQQQSGGRWRTRASISAWRVARAAGGGSLVQAHSIDPESGVAIILLGHPGKLRPVRVEELSSEILEELKKRDLPPDGVKISQGSFAWTSWDMRRNREVAVLQKVSGPFDAFDG